MPKRTAVQRLTVSLEPAIPSEALARDWQAFTGNLSLSYFQSWGWIETWLIALQAHGVEIDVARISDAAGLVGIALVGSQTLPRHRILRSRMRLLFATGEPTSDSVAFEYNHVVSSPSCRQQVTQALFEHLQRNRSWHEIQIAAVAETDTDCIVVAARAAGLRPLVRYTKPAFSVDLTALRAANRGPIDSFSSNTRQQVRRAMRGFEANGKLTLSRAKTLADARILMEEMQTVHTGHWRRLGQPGAFGTEFQRLFHARLVEQRFPHGEIDLLKVTAGDRPVGYLYNFVFRDVAANYQTAFAYDETDSKLKPGMVCHVLAMQDYQARGLGQYDLLMGEQRYKRSLASHEVRLSWLALHRSRVRHFIDRISGAIVPP